MVFDRKYNVTWIVVNLYVVYHFTQAAFRMLFSLSLKCFLAVWLWCISVSILCLSTVWSSVSFSNLYVYVFCQMFQTLKKNLFVFFYVNLSQFRQVFSQRNLTFSSFISILVHQIGHFLFLISTFIFCSRKSLFLGFIVWCWAWGSMLKFVSWVYCMMLSLGVQMIPSLVLVMNIAPNR